MIENLTRAEYDTVLRQDLGQFAAHCIAAKLTAVRQGKIRRLIINLPPRHLKAAAMARAARTA